MIDGGYTGDGVLDEVTQGILKEFDLLPAPKTLVELATI